MKTCKDCRYYDYDPRISQGYEGNVGHCTRLPPQALSMNRSTYPVVHEDLRACGLYKPEREPE